MTTDLRQALCGAVAEAPTDLADLRAVVEAGARRVRRRRLMLTGGTAVGVVVAALAWAGAVQGEHDPVPAKVVHLDLDRGRPLDLDALVSVRATWREYNTGLEGVLGVTDDGLVVRHQRVAGVGQRLGLLDPATGVTRWRAMPKTVGSPRPVDLTEEALVLYDWRQGVVLELDRTSDRWRRQQLDLVPGHEVHTPPQVEIGAGGRIYVGSSMEGGPFEMQWWSYELGSSEPRPEPDLRGRAVAWDGDRRVTAASDGRVVLSSAGGTDQVLSTTRPRRCDAPDLGFVPYVGFAGTRVVVTFWCDETAPVTVVYDPDGNSTLQIDESMAMASEGDHVLLRRLIPKTSGRGDTFFVTGHDTYLVDLAVPEARLVESASQAGDVGLAAGLVLWTQRGGPDHEHDVIWNAARTP